MSSRNIMHVIEHVHLCAVHFAGLALSAVDQRDLQGVVGTGKGHG